MQNLQEIQQHHNELANGRPIVLDIDKKAKVAVLRTDETDFCQIFGVVRGREFAGFVEFVNNKAKETGLTIETVAS